MHVAEYITDKIDNKNPGRNDGWTPLHEAARNGHLNVCEYIMQKIDNKNPGQNIGMTSLHFQALVGFSFVGYKNLYKRCACRSCTYSNPF